MIYATLILIRAMIRLRLSAGGKDFLRRHFRFSILIRFAYFDIYALRLFDICYAF